MGERQSTTWEGKRELGTISGARWSTKQVALEYVYGRSGIWGGVGFRGEGEGGGGNTRRKRMTMMGPRPSMGR